MSLISAPAPILALTLALVLIQALALTREHSCFHLCSTPCSACLVCRLCVCMCQVPSVTCGWVPNPLGQGLPWGRPGGPPLRIRSESRVPVKRYFEGRWGVQPGGPPCCSPRSLVGIPPCGCSANTRVLRACVCSLQRAQKGTAAASEDITRRAVCTGRAVPGRPGGARCDPSTPHPHVSTPPPPPAINADEHSQWNILAR